MKVTFVIPGVDGGGVRSVVRIATGLIANGHEVAIAYRERSRSIRDRMRDAYLSIRYNRVNGWIGAYPGIVRPYRNLSAQTVGHNDLVVGVGVQSVLEIAELPSSCGVKVHNCRGVEPWIGEAMRRAWDLPMPRIVVGAHLEPLMRKHGSTDPIFVATNGVDSAKYFPDAPEQDRCGVGTIYHGGEVKDPRLLLEVMAVLADRRPDVPLYMFGSYPRPAELTSRAEYARFPSSDKARALYSQSRVWFIGSRNEGLPNPMLEAMACGSAVVATDCGGPGDVIRDGENGLLVPVGDVQAMTGAILRLLDDAASRTTLARNGAATAAKLTWPAAVQAFQKALEAILRDCAAATVPEKCKRDCDIAIAHA